MAQRGGTDWQVKRSVLQCNKYMLESTLASDVRFRIRSPDGDTTEVAAHKYMLISRSPVFEALFCGDFSDADHRDGTRVDIFDVEADAFREMLKYLYYEEVDLLPDNVLPVLYAAKKYLLYPLAQKCKEFLENSFSADTVCTILNHSILYDEKELTEKCIEYIAPNCGQLITNSNFLDLSSSALSRILKCDYLYVDSEHDVFDACTRWASARIEGRSRDATDEELRSELGDNLGEIRFSSMAPESFARTVGRRRLLTDGEKSMLYYYQLTGEDLSCLTQLGFNPRSRVQRCSRYHGLGRNAKWWTCNGPGDAISFTVSKAVRLVGVSVYGGRDPGTHRASLELWGNSDVLLTKREHVLSSDGRDTPLPIYFSDHGVDLSPGESYTVVVAMKGSVTYYGEGGLVDPVSVLDLTFSFFRSDKSGNGTNVKSGQIPELLFLPKQPVFN